MNVAQALEHANTLAMPTLFAGTTPPDEERRANEEAIATLSSAWMAAPSPGPTFGYNLVRDLADHNRELCDAIGIEALQDDPGLNLARSLRDDDLVRGVAAMQGRDPDTVRKSAGPHLRDLGVAYTEAPVSGTVMGFDIETTSRDPDRGYIINIGMAFMELSANARPHDGHAAYFGLPSLYRQHGVPLADIHHITWDDLDGRPPFRGDAAMQRALLTAVTTFPLVAHNAAFEDSWLMLHLDGYAEARREGRVTLVDTRDICRRIDVDGRSMPRDSRPNALENWARRRGTLRPDEQERHLGLDDVLLMLRTMQVEFSLRGMFS